jgi:hypothetical protein
MSTSDSSLNNPALAAAAAEATAAVVDAVASLALNTNEVAVPDSSSSAAQSGAKVAKKTRGRSKAAVATVATAKKVVDTVKSTGKMVVAKAAEKKQTAKHSNPTYLQMITNAIRALNEPKGSSRPAIFKYIISQYHLDQKMAHVRGNLAIRNAIAAGTLKHGKSNATFKVGDKHQQAVSSDKSLKIVAPVAKQPQQQQPKAKPVAAARAQTSAVKAAPTKAKKRNVAKMSVVTKSRPAKPAVVVAAAAAIKKSLPKVEKKPAPTIAKPKPVATSATTKPKKAAAAVVAVAKKPVPAPKSRQLMSCRKSTNPGLKQMLVNSPVKATRTATRNVNKKIIIA